MRVAVMGAGSIGGYFGGMLARAGNDVTLIARGSHLQSILSDGLKVIRDEEEFVVRCHATDDPAQAGTPDLALLTVKTYHNSQAIPSMQPMIGPDTTVLCLQNGIDSYRSAADHLGIERVMPGAAYIEAGHPSPGVVTQTGAVVRIVFGEPDGGSSGRGERIRDALEDAGIPAELSIGHSEDPLEQVFVHRHDGRRHLTVQKDDGGIDASPGMAGSHRRRA